MCVESSTKYAFLNTCLVYIDAVNIHVDIEVHTHVSIYIYIWTIMYAYAPKTCANDFVVLYPNDQLKWFPFEFSTC